MSETTEFKIHVGEEIDALIAYVIAQMRADIEMGDQESLYDLLSRMPRTHLIGYLSDSRGDLALAAGVITEAEYDAHF